MPPEPAERPAVRREFLVACIMLLGGAAAYVAALVWRASSFVNGHYVPVGMDSFYHARRILDAVADPSAFYEFDPRMHVPEGSWINWPWGYDLLLAHVVRVLQHLTGAADPMAILVYIPPTWTFVNAALIVGIGVALGLQLRWLVVLALAFGLSPLTQELHGVGVIDHHYVEYTFVLATALTGLRWLQAPGDLRRAALLGAVLGAAPAFHNGLFLLQLPVDAVLFILWLRGELPPARSVRVLAAALIATTVAVLLPSEPFRDGQFSFTTLSWFHLYAAAASAGGALYLSARPCTRGSFALLAALAAAALVPAAHEILSGSRWIGAGFVKLDEMAETMSLWKQLHVLAPEMILGSYTAWLVLLPLVTLACAVGVVRRAPPPWLFAAAFGLFGTVLMYFQMRLHYYGSAALYIAPLLAVQHGVARLAAPRAALASLASVVVLTAGYVPAWRHMWYPVPPAWEFGGLFPVYDRYVFPPLRKACAEHPGTVLATNDDGHYIRYYTECSVISNNFIATAQHERKLLETQRALGLSAREVIDQYPYVDYIYLHQPADDSGLAHELLYGDGPYPAELQLVNVTLLKVEKGEGVLAKVFRIERAQPGDKG